MGNGRIPTVLIIDCEPDHRASSPDDPSPWAGFEAIAAQVDALRDRLATATGRDAHLAWGIRMDAQIATLYGSPTWAVERYGAFFDAATASGDTVGLHTHALRWTGPDSGWVSDYTDGWVQSVAEASFDTFGSAFGRPPIFHSFGENFMTTPLMNLVRRRGARFDFTLAPGERRLKPFREFDVRFTGVRPGYETVPRSPYCPSPDDFRRPHRDVNAATAPFLAVPMSSGRYVAAPIRARRIASDARVTRQAVTRVRHHLGTVRRTMLRQPHPAYGMLNMAADWRSPADFWDAAFAAVDAQAAPYLAFSIRSDTPVNPYLRMRFDAILDHLERDPRAERLELVTPEQAFGGAPQLAT